jgi:hypothetical protein
MPAVKDVGEPCAGEPHARFDGRALETERYGPRWRTELPEGNPGHGSRPTDRHRHCASALPDRHCRWIRPYPSYDVVSEWSMLDDLHTHQQAFIERHGGRRATTRIRLATTSAQLDRAVAR